MTDHCLCQSNYRSLDNEPDISFHITFDDTLVGLGIRVDGNTERTLEQGVQLTRRLALRVVENEGAGDQHIHFHIGQSA
jgi:hypothetical protein